MNYPMILRAISIRFIILFIFVSGMAAAHEGPAETAVEEITGKAAAFLDSLDPDKQEMAIYVFGADERLDWHYAPRSRPGVRIDSLDSEEQELGWWLMRAALSDAGYGKARDVIRLEEILGEITGRPDYRDPGNYSFVFFGDPRSADATNPWGWRFEGHHLSLSFTVAPGHDIAFTPAFYGTNPAVVPSGHPNGGWRVLEAEHRLAFVLLEQLDDESLEQVIVAGRTPGNIITGPGRETDLARPAGLPLGAMTDRQRRTALDLLHIDLDNIGEPFAGNLKEDVVEAGINRIHFAWAGATRRDAPHYYRFHGPTLIIEYDNTQGGGNHVHSVWHDPNDSFGGDLLRFHRLNHPHD